MESELTIQQCIERIKLNKEEERMIYSKEYIELMENDLFYSNMYKKTIEWLTNIRKNFSTNKDFYKYTSTIFAKTYIPAIIQEYSIMDNNLLNILNNISNGNNIKIFEKGEAEKFVKTFGKEINGDLGAFKFQEFICFTPDNDSKNNIVSEQESIDNASRMLGSMIHETMHLLIDVTKKEKFNPNDPDLKTSGGFILNEGLVEMYSQDLSRKYGIIQNPSLYYFNNVKLCREMKKIIGEEEFKRISFHGNYIEILSYLPEQYAQQYRINERIRYLDRKSINYDINNINIIEENKTL